MLSGARPVQVTLRSRATIELRWVISLREHSAECRLWSAWASD
jgi:hypothetical protein